MWKDYLLETNCCCVEVNETHLHYVSLNVTRNQLHPRAGHHKIFTTRARMYKGVDQIITLLIWNSNFNNNNNNNHNISHNNNATLLHCHH